MLLLGIDVCSGACSTALVRDGRTVAARHEPMTRGHVERLAPMVAEVLAVQDVDASDLDGIAVTTGPRSFTGARLGVAFARGLSFASGVPVTGISVFEVMASGTDGTILIAMPGKNDALMLQGFSNGQALDTPGEYTRDHISLALPAGPFTVIGPASDALIDALDDDTNDRALLGTWAAITAEDVARSAVASFTEHGTSVPAPLYLRAPDAKPQPRATPAP